MNEQGMGASAEADRALAVPAEPEVIPSASQFETEVDFRGGKRVVQFDYEGDGIIVWNFEGENTCLGEDTTKAEQQSIYEQLWAYLTDWWASLSDIGD